MVGVVRELLPVTEVTTVVKDSSGHEIYRSSTTEQDDIIELFSEMSTVDLLDAILDAKKAEIDGPEYLGSVQLYTSVMADLNYIERKIKAALRTIDTPSEAREQLLLAEVNGVEMDVSEVESPLMDARRALALAEVQVKQQSFDLAKENLDQAKISLDEYRKLFDTSKNAEIETITAGIEDLQKDLKKDGISDAIRDLWHKTVHLFKRDSPKTAASTDVDAADAS